MNPDARPPTEPQPHSRRNNSTIYTDPRDAALAILANPQAVMLCRDPTGEMYAIQGEISDSDAWPDDGAITWTRVVTREEILAFAIDQAVRLDRERASAEPHPPAAVTAFREVVKATRGEVETIGDYAREAADDLDLDESDPDALADLDLDNLQIALSSIHAASERALAQLQPVFDPENLAAGQA